MAGRAPRGYTVVGHVAGHAPDDLRAILALRAVRWNVEGWRMADHLENEGKRRVAVAALSAAMFLVLATVPFWDEKAGRVGLAAYGPRPLGLPWQAFHVLTALILCLPMPAFWSSMLLVWLKARDAGVVLSDPLSWLFHYPGLRRDPRIAGPLARFTVLAAGYLLVAVLWIAYAAHLGV